MAAHGAGQVRFWAHFSLTSLRTFVLTFGSGFLDHSWEQGTTILPGESALEVIQQVERELAAESGEGVRTRATRCL
jgi:hypothetical protein